MGGGTRGGRMDTECCWCSRTRVERSVCFLYMNFEIPLLISLTELRHNVHHDLTNSLLGLTHFLALNGSPWENNFFSIHHNLLCALDCHVCVAYRADLFNAGHEPKLTQEHSRSNHWSFACLWSRTAPSSHGKCSLNGRWKPFCWFCWSLVDWAHKILSSCTCLTTRNLIDLLPTLHPRLKSMPLATPLSAAMVVGLVGVFLLAWASSINSGSAKKSGRLGLCISLVDCILTYLLTGTWKGNCWPEV